MNKKIVAIGSLLSSLFLMSGTTYANMMPTQNFNQPGWNQNCEKQHDARMKVLINKLGLKETEVKKELEDGKTLKQVFDERGITKEQFQNAFAPAKNMNNGKHLGLFKKQPPMMNLNAKMPAEILQVQAKVLGMTIDELKKALQNRQRPMDLAIAKGMTAAEFHQKVAAQLQLLIKDGKITGPKADFFNKRIEKMNPNPQSSEND